jgi:hypothetical protein
MILTRIKANKNTGCLFFIIKSSKNQQKIKKLFLRVFREISSKLSAFSIQLRANRAESDAELGHVVSE